MKLLRICSVFRLLVALEDLLYDGQTKLTSMKPTVETEVMSSGVLVGRRRPGLWHGSRETLFQVIEIFLRLFRETMVLAAQAFIGIFLSRLFERHQVSCFKGQCLIQAAGRNAAIPPLSA